ncbi:PREDICTED: uncharacterized protein LOC109190279 [Ipomoea nil]|uniref:uncharacterized protein LOC109190279 n=1 Tax=Ipomoea nil TaxID=35883 RepID=UPI000900A427|nr:PREDICTED: uncharacterized protein LOC109190279 [Ipomoea nil]
MRISGEEDDELSEMVRDFLESDSSFISAAGYNNDYNENSSDDQPHQVEEHQLSLQEILENATEAETEILEKIMSYWREAEEIKMETKELRKWMVSRLRMDGYDASLCKTYGVKTSAHSSSAFKFTGDYEYIDVMMKNNESEGEQLRVIVETDLRSQFEVARPTEAYKELSSFLPCIFVGTEHRLHTIISLLCEAAKQSLKESGLHVPPWRKATYMQSKWLSQNCNKIIPFSPF